MTSAEVIFNAAQRHIEIFIEELFEPNMLWLKEVHQNAIKIFGASQEVLLPRTPCAKRKFADVEKSNAIHKESTFHAGLETKKLKIDDLSTILDCSVTELSSYVSANNSRSLRPRKHKDNSQIKNRSKRQPVKKNDVKSIVVSQKFIPPTNVDSVKFEGSKISTPVEASNNSTLQATHVHFSNATVVKISPQKTPNLKEKKIPMSNNGNFFKKIQCHINFEDAGEMNSTPDNLKKKTIVEDSPSPVNELDVSIPGVLASTPEKMESNNADPCIPMESSIPNETEISATEMPLPAVQSSTGELSKISTTDNLQKKTIVENSPLPVSIPDVLASTPEIEIKNADIPAGVKEMSSSEEKTNAEMVNGGSSVDIHPKDTNDISAVLQVSPKNPKSNSPDKSPKKIKAGLATKTGQSPAKKLKVNDDEEKENFFEEAGRRDTYKVMVGSIIDGHSKKPAVKVESNKQSVPDKDTKKVPKVTKPVKPASNVVTNIKSFLKRPGSPKTAAGHAKPGGNVVSNVKSLVKQPSPRKEQTGIVKQGNVVTNVKSFVKQPSPKKEQLGTVKQGNVVTNLKSFVKQPSPKKEQPGDAKKAAELEKKELLRQNTIKEGLKKKQQQIDEKKRIREEREKHLAEQLQKRQEENEKRRQLLEQKEAQIAKNQDEIRKARELEEKQKKEIRDAKKAELDARRQREEEEQRKKATELLNNEKRKQEVLLRKNELDEQKRLKKKAEKEMLEKDKLRLIEEYRSIDEERKKKVFEEKEKHRLEVIKKKEEEKEKERQERLIREEKNRQAEKAIIDGKKREEERQKEREEEKLRAKQKLREEIKNKFQHGYTKALVDVPTALRSSPRLKDQPPVKLNRPVIPLVQRDSVYTNYGIDDLDSDDSTDDESEPSKKIPSWAVGSRLKRQLHRQFYTNIDPDDIFFDGCMEPLRLEKIFMKNKKIYFTRSSSAHWNSPPIKGLGYNYS